jgi:hypothetical protein
MTDPETGPGPEVEPEEPFMSRWSRLKARSRAPAAPVAEAGTALPQAGDDTPPRAGQDPAPPQAAPQAPAAPPPELPDIDLLGEDSDYSAFLAEGVDATLRRKALRKLFHSPKFNVLDGLDDYMGDYTQFEPLGSIITADMRHQIERAARLAEQALAEDGERPASADPAAAAAVAAEAATAEDSSDHATENHDEPDRTA